MNILITGASGFLGKTLVKELQKSDLGIVVVGRSLEKLETAFGSEIVKKETDYSLGSLSVLIRGVDVVVHLASQLMTRHTDPLKISDFYENLQVVENLMIACQKNSVKQFINTSSISVYHLGKNLSETDFLAPSNIYGVSKASIDSYLAYFQNKTKTNIVSLRLARLYGAGEREGLMFTDFINKATRKQPLTVFGKGKSTIDYIYVKDIVDVFQIILSNSLIRGFYNVGTGKSYSIQQIAEEIAEIFETKIQYIEDKPDGVLGSEMNVSKIYEQLGWKAKWGLKDSVLDIKKIFENE